MHQLLLSLTFILLSLPSWASHSDLNNKKTIENHLSSSDGGDAQTKGLTRALIDQDYDKFHKWALKEIGRLDVRKKFKLADIDVVDGVNLSLEYLYDVRPSYVDSYYSRTDKWSAEVGVNPNAWLVNPLPISASTKQSGEIQFIRQFKSQFDAIKALPLTPKSLPLTAQKAISELTPGTYVSLPLRMNFLLGNNFLLNHSSVFSTKAGIYYILSGEFQIQIFRLKDNKVRLRITAARKKGVEASISTKTNLQIIKIDLVDKLISSVIGSELFSWGLFKKEKGNMLFADYELDLNSPKAQRAYDNALSSSLRFKPLELANPLKKEAKIEELLVSDLRPLDQLAHEDKDKKPSKKRATRLYKGKNDSQTKSFKISVGLKRLKFGTQKSYSENKMSYLDEDNQEHRLKYNAYTSKYKRRALLGFFASDKVYKTYALSNGHENINKDNFSDFGTSFEMKKKRLSRWAQRDLKEKIKFNLPPLLANTIKWDEFIAKKSKGWNKFFTRDSQRNVRVYYNIAFKKEALLKLKDVKFETVDKKFHQAMSDFREKYPNRNDLYLGVDIYDSDIHSSKYWNYTNDRDEILRTVKGIISLLRKNSTPDTNKISEKFLKLSDNRLYREFGHRFLFSLFDEETIQKHVSMEFNWSSKEKGQLSYTHPPNGGKSRALAMFERIQSEMAGQSFGNLQADFFRVAPSTDPNNCDCKI